MLEKRMRKMIVQLSYKRSVQGLYGDMAVGDGLRELGDCGAAATLLVHPYIRGESSTPSDCIGLQAPIRMR